LEIMPTLKLIHRLPGLAGQFLGIGVCPEDNADASLSVQDKAMAIHVDHLNGLGG
jgi:hypothetical protein